MKEVNEVPTRQVRAVYDAETIRVYQAYGPVIGSSLVEHGRFVDPPFKLSRMTWIKPSFLWMMYRCGWSYKDDGQRRVFAFDIHRSGFEWAIANSCSSHPSGMTRKEARALMDEHPVRVQWDPERDLHSNPLTHRSIQIGLSGEAIRLYAKDWIVNFEEITDFAKEVYELVKVNDLATAAAMLPDEKPYALPDELAQRVGIS
ncbi:MAG: DUF4291 domain-containing protein [Planctomycetaceae bacterium]